MTAIYSVILLLGLIIRICIPRLTECDCPIPSITYFLRRLRTMLSPARLNAAIRIRANVRGIKFKPLRNTSEIMQHTRAVQS